MIGLILATMVSMNSNFSPFDVQGHRGARGTLPENTLPAFAAAIESGASTLELDLHISLDGEVVIVHDYSLSDEFYECEDEAFLSSKPLVRSLRLRELKEVDCGSKTNPRFPRQKCLPGTKIPTLDELLDMVSHSTHPNAKKIRLNLEVKRDPTQPELSVSAEELASKIVAKVREKGFSQRVYYSSFDPEVLGKIRKLDPQAVLGFLYEETSIDFARKLCPENPIQFLLNLAKSLNARILSPEDRLLTDAAFVQELHQLGFLIVPWTVNAEEEWERMIDMGVDGLITDYPEELIGFIEKRGSQ